MNAIGEVVLDGESSKVKDNEHLLPIALVPFDVGLHKLEIRRQVGLLEVRHHARSLLTFRGLVSEPDDFLAVERHLMTRGHFRGRA